MIPCVISYELSWRGEGKCGWGPLADVPQAVRQRWLQLDRPAAHHKRKTAGGGGTQRIEGGGLVEEGQCI
jgi:hypothetical protein